MKSLCRSSSSAAAWNGPIIAEVEDEDEENKSKELVEDQSRGLVEVPRKVLDNCGLILAQATEAIAKAQEIAENSASTFEMQKDMIVAHKAEIDQFLA